MPFITEQPITAGPTQTRGGFAFLGRTKEVKIGAGDTVFASDIQGIWLGNAVFGSAPFRVAMDGTLTVTGATITSGTFRTAASGERIEITGNVLNVYSASGQVGKISGTAGQNIFAADINSSTDSRGLLVIANKIDGTIEAARINIKGNQRALFIDNSNDYLENENLLGVDITSNHASRTAANSGVRFRNLGKGLCLQVTSGAGATGPSIFSSHQATADSYGWHLEFTHNDNDYSPIYVDKTSTGAGYIFEGTQAAVVSTNFKRGLKLAGWSLWVSNGNTPNAALSGTAGDICVNADSGKTYYCTGTTNWTAM